MTSLNADEIRGALNDDAREHLAQLDVFAEIDSTNSYLMQRAGPVPGRLCAAVTTNQTAGRGRRGNRWVAPPDSGVCLSIAHTYASQPAEVASMTLAMGVAAIDALGSLGVSDVALKWPNDLVAQDGKLGGILTEAQQQSTGAVTVVTGIGVNVDLKGLADSGGTSEWSSGPIDLHTITTEVPAFESLAAALINTMSAVYRDFEGAGFSRYLERWKKCDWLFGRPLVIETADGRVKGIAAGVGHDGALLVADDDGETQRITTGSVARAGKRQVQP